MNVATAKTRNLTPFRPDLKRLSRSSSRVGQFWFEYGEEIHRLLKRYTPGLSTECYKLCGKVKVGDTVTVRSSGFYLNETHVAGNQYISEVLLSKGIQSFTIDDRFSYYRFIDTVRFMAGNPSPIPIISHASVPLIAAGLWLSEFEASLSQIAHDCISGFTDPKVAGLTAALIIINRFGLSRIQDQLFTRYPITRFSRAGVIAQQSKLWLGVISVLMPLIVTSEELLFRWGYQGHLSGSLGQNAALILSSALFSLSHCSWNRAVLFSTMMLCLSSGLLFLHTDNNLAGPIAFHIYWNTELIFRNYYERYIQTPIVKK